VARGGGAAEAVAEAREVGLGLGEVGGKAQETPPLAIIVCDMYLIFFFFCLGKLKKSRHKYTRNLKGT